MFGTKNIYGDLKGGDMFYIGPLCRSFGLNPEVLWECEEGTDLPEAVIADLERVTHILLPYCVFRHYGAAYNLRYLTQEPENPRLKTDLARFKGLKKVYLACRGHDDYRDDRPQGQVNVEHDTVKFKPIPAYICEYWGTKIFPSKSILEYYF